MKKTLSLTLLIFLLKTIAIGQELIQIVRGRILDNDSRLPLIGVTITIVDSDPVIGTVTDNNGNFRLENVSVGRITLEFSYLGYEGRTIPNIEVNSGKEVVINLNLQESVVKMDEVVVKAVKNKGQALNDMSIVSSRSMSVEETKRYAGGFDDPARVVSNYAGVTNTGDGSSDIIVRGNAPKYIQWRLDGTEISSPYHFDDQNASFGALTVLNNNLLAASDFYTGAFSPEYGNVLSSVFDLRLRAGNNEKFESAIGFGLIGTDITIEGPFKKGYTGSFLMNYRYSTASLIQDIGLIDADGLLKFQDANFKLVFPTKKIGTFSIFSIGGLSNFYLEDLRTSLTATVTTESSNISSIRKDYVKGNYMLNTGLNHTLTINDNSFIKTCISYSATGIMDDWFKSRKIEIYNSQGEHISDSVINRTLNFKNRLLQSTYQGAVTYNNKINTKNKVQIGTKYALFECNYRQSKLNSDSIMFTLIDFKENVSTIQNFISWKLRLGENITIVSGFHNMNVLLNNKSTLEPRIAINWKINDKNSFHAGFGNHSTMESIHHYFARIEQTDGSISEPNKELGLLKAHHYVLGYEKRFNGNFMAKVELYYQYLYNLPVENNDTSYFATINESVDYKYVDLVNEGTGKNYGLEITFERFFDNDYYFLINASLFNSTYKSLEGIERNTLYNKNYLANMLFGKEFHNLGKKNNQTMALNCKIFFQGGQRYIPLLRNNDGDLAVDIENNNYYDYERAYEDHLDNIYQVNLSVSYKFNRKKATHEVFIDLQNLTNSMGKIFEYYDDNQPDSIAYTEQFGFFPNLMYRVYF